MEQVLRPEIKDALDVAERSVQEAIVSGSGQEIALILMGRVYRSLGREAEANLMFAQCLASLQNDDSSIDTVDSDVLIKLAENGHKDAIEAILLRLIARAEQMPDDQKTKLLDRVAMVYFCIHRFDEAIDAVAQIPDESVRHRRLLLHTQFLASADQIEKATSVAARYDLGIEGRLRIALGLAEVEKYPEALDIVREVAKEAAEENNNTATNYDDRKQGFDVARVCAMCGNVEFALNIVQQVGYDSRETYEVHSEAANYFMRTKQFDTAISHARKMGEYGAKLTQELTPLFVLNKLVAIATTQAKSEQKEVALSLLNDIQKELMANEPKGDVIASSDDPRMVQRAIQIRESSKKFVGHLLRMLISSYAKADSPSQAITIFGEWYRRFPIDNSSEVGIDHAAQVITVMAEAGLAYGNDPLIASMEV